MDSKVWTTGNLYVDQAGNIVQLIALARQNGSKEQLAVYQAMYAPFSVWAVPADTFLSSHHKVEKDSNVPVKCSAGQEQSTEALECGTEQKRSIDSLERGAGQEQPTGSGTERNASRALNEDASVPSETAPVSEEELRTALEKGQPEKYLSGRITEAEIARRGMLQILDAESFQEKRQLLVGLRPYIDKLLLHNIAAALDVVLEEGPLDDQFESLLHCVDAHARYEGGRLRS